MEKSSDAVATDAPLGDRFDMAYSGTLRQVDHFGRLLAVAILAVSALTFLYGVLWRGHPAAEMFMMVVALAAAAIPEGLPAIMTVTLALGVQRMAQRNAIIRRLPAVETLGSVTVICSDKTGILTRNEMTVQRVVCAEQVLTAGGAGYQPQGDLSHDGRVIDPEHYPPLSLAIRAGVLCNDARLHERAPSRSMRW
jgi:magnesium-transporting ATPase (P-type)